MLFVTKVQQPVESEAKSVDTPRINIWKLSDRKVKAKYNDAVNEELGANRITGDATTWGNVIMQRSQERMALLTKVLTVLTGAIALGTAWTITKELLLILGVLDKVCAVIN